ncbi:MAG: hypothetical protein EHM72_04015 [Calditrichaeota bacterium]|nr:MAG: hypothetical protein EHM72_04015 [Calditrichota bacterium]
MEFRQQYADLPFDHQLRRRFAETELLLNESESALKNNNYLRASTLIQESESKLGVVDQQVTAYLDAYLRQLPQWRRWAEETITWSRENSACVLIVNKLERKLYVYESGKPSSEFSVEFGPNWIGPKKQRGDGRTPEGQYHIRKKKEHQQTAYYLALEIDYPNEDDQKEFERAQGRGEISSNAHIGGLIEIHGEGGRGLNWTEGCVALKNGDMEKLFMFVQVGTPVTIVGSLNGQKKNTFRAKK